MGDVIKFLFFFVIVHAVANSYAQKSKRFFRKDYTYLNTTESFYKIHTLQKTWREAKKICEMEGASLFYPEDENEVNAVLAFWKKTHDHFSSIYIGISDLLVKEVYNTVDGRPIMDVYSKWDAGEPNDVGGVEDCVIFRNDLKLNDIPCENKNQFICRKKLEDLEWNQECHMPRTDYVYNRQLGHCYKFHTDPKNWNEAVTVCNAEQSILAAINSQVEAYFLTQLTAQKKKNNVRGITTEGVVFLGFHNRDGEEWKTIKGEILEDIGYSTWAPGKPDGGDEEKCGAMLFNGQLEDLGCNQRCFYVCKHIISRAEEIDERLHALF